MCLDHCLLDPQGFIVLCSELGHSIVVGLGHGIGVPLANPKLAHHGGQYRDLVNEAPHTLVQHLSPMCQVHPSLDLGLPRLVQGGLCTLNNITKVHSVGMAWYFWAQYKMAKFLWRMDKYIR